MFIATICWGSGDFTPPVSPTIWNTNASEEVMICIRSAGRTRSSDKRNGDEPVGGGRGRKGWRRSGGVLLNRRPPSVKSSWNLRRGGWLSFDVLMVGSFGIYTQLLHPNALFPSAFSWSAIYSSFWVWLS